MTHFFYRKRRELPPKSPLLPLIHAEQSKQEKYAAMLKSGSDDGIELEVDFL